MFVILSKYTRPLEDQQLVAEHIAFVESMYKSGTFIASGPRSPFTGGVIVARGDNEAALRESMSRDPFIREGIVTDYDYVQFRASKAMHSDLIET
ncbi:MAG: hypothetical protein HYZ39_10330 [Mycolicibacterium cosmeticum]|nr:hypothetical protein [Mycolicibacterium cosmeticum]